MSRIASSNLGVNSLGNNDDLRVSRKENIEQVQKNTTLNTNNSKTEVNTNPRIGIESELSGDKMRVDLENSLEGLENTTNETLNTRGEKVFNVVMENLENPIGNELEIITHPVDTNIENDKGILSEKTYTNKEVVEKFKEVSDSTLVDLVKGSGFIPLIKDLDSTLLKDKVYSKAQALGKNMSEGVTDKMKLALTLRSDSELNEIVAKSIAVKDKYHESYDKALSNYTEGIGKLSPLLIKVKEIDKNETLSNQEKKDLKKEIYTQVYKIAKKYDLSTYYPIDKGNPISINDLKQPPSLYSVLPSNKQKFINNIVEGIKEGLPNKVSNETQHFIVSGGEIDVPKTLNFNDKKYIVSSCLGTGGLGAIMKYVNENDPTDTVVVKNLLQAGKRDELIHEIKNHLHAFDNPNAKDHVYFNRA